MEKRGKLQTTGQFKKGGESRNSWLDSNNKFYILTKMKVGISNSEGIKEKKQGRKQENKKERVEIRKAVKEGVLREITVKIGLKRIDTQKEITMKVLLDSSMTELVMSSEFARK